MSYIVSRITRNASAEDDTGPLTTDTEEDCFVLVIKQFRRLWQDSITLSKSRQPSPSTLKDIAGFLSRIERLTPGAHISLIAFVVYLRPYICRHDE